MAAKKTATKRVSYVVTAKSTMTSGKMSKTEAEKLKMDIKRKAPNATVTIKKV